MGLATLPHYCQFILNSVIGGVDRVDSDGMYTRQGNNSFKAVTVETVLQSTILGDDEHGVKGLWLLSISCYRIGCGHRTKRFHCFWSRMGHLNRIGVEC